MKRLTVKGLLVAVCLLALAGCGALLARDDDTSGGDVTTNAAKKIDKASLRLAPEIRSERWLNGAPTSLAELRGKVVLVDFWTFG